MRALLIGGWLALGGCAVAPLPAPRAAAAAAGEVAEARLALAARIVAAPHDLPARRALAALEERAGRPTAAIVELEAVIDVGGLGGPRWSDDDRARLGRLIHDRGRARLARGAASAAADLALARALGVAIDPAEQAAADRLVAVAGLRHVDPRRRLDGLRRLAALATTPDAPSAWRGARPGATTAELGALGGWLWREGARLAAREALAAWRSAAAAPLDPALEAAYLRAEAWWRPVALGDAVAPAALRGVARCGFAAAGCTAHDLTGADAPTGEDRRAALLAPAGIEDAPAAVAIAIDRALAGQGGLAGNLRALLRPEALTADAIGHAPAALRPILALAGEPGSAAVDPVTVVDDDRAARRALAVARGLAGAPLDRVIDGLPGDDAAALVARLGPPPRPLAGDPAVVAAARFASRGPGAPAEAGLAGVAQAWRVAPVTVDRRAAAVIAAAIDGAAAQAALGALFDGLGDPARARAAWQAAVDVSPEPAWLLGLALAEVHAGDPDAALLTATAAAAASGDPAPALLAVAAALLDVDRPVAALTAARGAIDLASPDVLGPALDVARAASLRLGRGEQAAALAAQRATAAPPLAVVPGDPTDAAAALAAYASRDDAAAVAGLWVASRWQPRDVAVRKALRGATAGGDPRRAVVEAELVVLAGDPDDVVARAAVAALR